MTASWIDTQLDVLRVSPPNLSNLLSVSLVTPFVFVLFAGNVPSQEETQIETAMHASPDIPNSDVPIIIPVCSSLALRMSIAQSRLFVPASCALSCVPA